MCHHYGKFSARFDCDTLVFSMIFKIISSVFSKLPDLMHSESLQTDPFPTFVCQNFGLLLGICIMLIIALYEEDLMAVTW